MSNKVAAQLIGQMTEAYLNALDASEAKTYEAVEAARPAL